MPLHARATSQRKIRGLSSDFIAETDVEPYATFLATVNPSATYNHWRSVDPDAKVLSLIFNICIAHGRIPEAWKCSRTIFIPKGSADSSNPLDWRSIAYSRTIAKLFCSCLARRLSGWIEAFQVLSPSLKGFLPYDGSFKDNFVVNQRIQSARANGKEACLLSIDLSNAFDSIAHNAIGCALRSAGSGDRSTCETANHQPAYLLTLGRLIPSRSPLVSDKNAP